MYYVITTTCTYMPVPAISGQICRLLEPRKVLYTKNLREGAYPGPTTSSLT